jgi:3-hydroxybutyrate dehydrogenase
MNDHERLKGKSAVITGSTSGIGLGLACALAEKGVNILLNGLGEPDEIRSAKERVEDNPGVKVSYSPADLRIPGEIAGMIEQAHDEFSSVDILINNAGLQHVAPIEEFPPGKWEEIIAVMLSAPFYTIRAALPIMRKQPWGRIINTASVHSLVASPFKAAYVSAKHGLSGLIKTVALELAETSITINGIAPGYVETPLVSGQIADTATARGITEEEVITDVMLHAQPSKRLVTIEEISALALFLCRDEAGSINGITLPIDGGWTAQ